MTQSVDIKVGFTCNNNCLHCVVADKRKHPDLLLQEIIQEMEFFINKYKCISIVLTGGEFTIRDDVYTLIDEIASRKNAGKIEKVNLQTNGCAIADKQLAQALSRVVDNFLIAIHAGHPDLHDAITRTPGSFWQTVQGIMNIQDCVRDGARCSLTSQTVISNFNYPVLSDLFSILSEGLKIKSTKLTFPHPNGNAYSRAVVPEYSEIAPYVNEVLALCLEKNIYIGTEHIPLCVLERSLQQRYAKHILQKKYYAVGYDRSCQKTQGRLDYGVTLPTQYRKWSTCAECLYNDACIGVWKEYMEFYAEHALTPITVAV